METPEEIKQALKNLFQTQMLAVLSTSDRGQPYGTLVAFAASTDLERLFFATSRATRKYAYIGKEPRVSLLIDSRSHSEEDFHRAIAVTALGTARETPHGEAAPDRADYLSKHPSLRGFLASPTTAFFEVQIAKYILVRQFQNVVEYRP